MGSLRTDGHNDLCVGIDLGTTNSVLATINEKLNGDIVSKVVDIARTDDMYNAVSGDVRLSTTKKAILPSCVYYRQEKNYEPLVGDFARKQYPLRPHLVAKSIKSQMGNAAAQGLSPDIPDKTPAQISSRILRHMLKEASKVYRCEITDAVITVPANFDSVMCKATRDAAELAGIRVRNDDGSERPVLLSEPNAVVYDLINQIHNGEISARIIDLSEKKRVMVFDLGGGTLDITLHEIKRRGEKQEVLKVDEIATNRYTRLGGDDFDEAIAKEMYSRYMRQYAGYPEVVAKIRNEESAIMPTLKDYAEQLKLSLNERCGDDYDSGWDDPDDEITFPVGGGIGGIGYAYDDTFSKEEVERILSVFMAEELTYSDYKDIERISNTRNIIYPILDVLKKASIKLNEENVVVDAVIINGGMSKFYMVCDRLKAFFGFDPIVALDPDQAVARGAAVYHYYLHKYDEMQDDMKLLGADANRDVPQYEHSEIVRSRPMQADKPTMSRSSAVQPAPSRRMIEWGKNILNDCLYLGVKNGAVHEIIPTGAELPYQSPIMTGFRVEPNQSKVAIPIKSRNLDGTYRVIANGNISFNREYPDGAYVAFMIHMDSNKVITMKAWTSSDVAGQDKLEAGTAKIAVNTGERSAVKSKILAPSGAILNPREQVHNLTQLVKNFVNAGNKQRKSQIAKKINFCINTIYNAGNKEDFAEAILDALEHSSLHEARERLFTVARRLGGNWQVSEQKRLAGLCMLQLGGVMNGLAPSGGPRVSANIQAIYAMSICADRAQLGELSAIHSSSQYRQACLYTHAKTQTEISWLRQEFEKDIQRCKEGKKNFIQHSAYALGLALRKNEAVGMVSSSIEEDVIATQLCSIISSGMLSTEELTCCLLALGWICDQRYQNSNIRFDLQQEVLKLIDHLAFYYEYETVMKQGKACNVVRKMINGDQLNVDEEAFLLTKLFE
ncbi:MAG: Hsp70 family protein [Selenomonadales bacterium]|nr:Hsp70 family protein [Selenomonadales bacterium]